MVTTRRKLTVRLKIEILNQKRLERTHLIANSANSANLAAFLICSLGTRTENTERKHEVHLAENAALLCSGD